MVINVSQAITKAKAARHAYRVAKMVGDTEGMKKADFEHRQLLNYIRNNR